MLILKNISKKLGQFELKDINIEISEGTYYVLLGRSGSGKTQLLELIAGLNTPDSGEVWLEGQEITGKKIQERGIGLVFQDYAVFPNMTVYGNIAYPLHSIKISKDQISDKVNCIAADLNIKHLLDRKTTYLSGGELQRVALARTLIRSPKLLLLDEPMASIDASLKDDIRRLFRRLNKKGLTIIHVTHDYTEAVSLANMVGVLHNGRIIQEGTPGEVFRKPVNKFVARYAGIRNFFRVEIREENGQKVAVTDKKQTFRINRNNHIGEGLLLLRSEDIQLSIIKPQVDHINCYSGTVREIIPSGSGLEVIVEAGESFYVDVTTESFRKEPFTENSQVWVTFLPEAGIALKGTS